MGTSLIRNCHPPQDHHRALGMALLQGPMGGGVLMSEVPLYIYKTPSPFSNNCGVVQGYLAHKKTPPPRTLQ